MIELGRPNGLVKRQACCRIYLHVSQSPKNELILSKFPTDPVVLGGEITLCQTVSLTIPQGLPESSYITVRLSNSHAVNIGVSNLTCFSCSVLIPPGSTR